MVKQNKSKLKIHMDIKGFHVKQSKGKDRLIKELLKKQGDIWSVLTYIQDYITVYLEQTEKIVKQIREMK